MTPALDESGPGDHAGGADALAARLADLDERIADAARSAGRPPAEVTRIVVTKFHPASLVEHLHALGVRDVGENRQQELTAKRTTLPPLDAYYESCVIGGLGAFSLPAENIETFAMALRSKLILEIAGLPQTGPRLERAVLPAPVNCREFD